MRLLKSLWIQHALIVGKPLGQYEIGLRPRDQDPSWPGSTHQLADLLPSCLTTLKLDYDNWSMTWGVDYNAQLSDVLNASALQLPLLKKVDIRYQHYMPGRNILLKLWTLQQEAQKFGIALKYRLECFMDDMSM